MRTLFRHRNIALACAAAALLALPPPIFADAFYFAVDTTMNGQVDWETLSYDSATVFR